jgi:tetratricopeptide (TPR) repeat protein
VLSALHARSSAAGSNAQESLWKACQSGNPDDRVAGCSGIIAARGFGSSSRYADALDARCWAYHSKQLYAAAEADCLAAIQLKPRYSYAYNNLGAAYLGSKNFVDALKALDTAISLKPNYLWSRFNRAKALAALGRREEAVRDLQAALALASQNSDVRTTFEDLMDSLSLR